jgi:hypothetical protein
LLSGTPSPQHSAAKEHTDLRRIGIAAVTLLGLLASSTPAHALTILGNLNSSAVGPDNSAPNGGGNIEDVFAAAANVWEGLLLDDVTITIGYGWIDGFDPLAFYDGTDISVLVGHDWFVDPTPALSEEYTSAALVNATLNGTTIDYATGFTGGLGAADGFDLFTILLHEIGHALQIANGANPFPDYADGDVDVTAPRPLAGLELPVSGVHLDTPAGYIGLRPLMFTFMNEGQRRLISDADLLFVAQSGDWQRVNGSGLAAAPEPASLTLLGLGTMALAWRRRPRS